MKTLIKRPSRYQQNKAGYEITLSGLCMGKAIQAVQTAETDLHDTCGDIQEGGLVSPDAWNVVHVRHDKRPPQTQRMPEQGRCRTHGCR